MTKLSDILFNRGPWGGNNGDGRKNPWGDKKPRQAGDRPRHDDVADLEAILREAQNKFKIFGGGGGRGGKHGKGESFGFGIIFLIILGLWLSTGLYRVQPSEHGAIMTFGKHTKTQDKPGLGYHAPWPIQDIIKVDVAQNRRVVIGFNDDGGSRSLRSNVTDVASESLMVTGDENIISIHFVVLWHIDDAANYLFEIRDPENTIKKVAESAMREIIGRTEIQKALTESRADVESKTRDLMQKILDEYKSGISVDTVQLQKVDPPASVVDAFDDVQRARADRERLRNEAETYRNDIVPVARGQAQKLLQDAEAYKEAVIKESEGEAGRFKLIYKSYKSAKDITTKRLYIETIEEILGKSNKFIVGENGGAPVLPYLPLDKMAKGKK